MDEVKDVTDKEWSGKMDLFVSKEQIYNVDNNKKGAKTTSTILQFNMIAWIQKYT